MNNSIKFEPRQFFHLGNLKKKTIFQTTLFLLDTFPIMYSVGLLAAKLYLKYLLNQAAILSMGLNLTCNVAFKCNDVKPTSLSHS